MNTARSIQRRIGFIAAALLCVPLSVSLGCSEQGSDSQNASNRGESTPADQDQGAQLSSTAPTNAPTMSALPELAPVASGIEWDAPDGWEQVQPTSPMRAAMYVVDGVECIFFSFANNGGGSAESNIERWSGQVLDEQGEPSTPSVSTFETSGLTITTVALRGTYMSGMPGGGARTPQPDSLFLGAIIENGPDGPVFIRMVGPSNEIDEARESWEMMVRSIRPFQM